MMHGRDGSVKVPVGEVTLRVQCTGAGTPVLLLHGFPDSLSLWREVSPRLAAAGHRVIAVEWFRDHAPRAGR